MFSIRKIGVVGRTYRHLARYRQILTVFFKYGFGDLIELLKIEQYIEIGLQLISKNRRSRLEKISRAERVRMACEELGPTYIKFGQILSTRPDLVPVDFIKELSKLQDNVPSSPFSEVSKIIESELGAPPEDIFEFFEKAPLASASIGQVYRATLKDGEEVAVKVQRPGIKKIIEVDLEIMLHLATLMEHHIEEMSLHQPVKIVEEFARTLEKEIDYTIEATNMERISRNFLNDLTIYIPKVFRDTTTESILTTELVEGIKVSEIDRLEKAGLDRKLITVRGADIVLKQIIKHGFFHADPHPGNIFILPDNVICLLDFGMTGSVDRRTREDFSDLAESVVTRNESRATQVLLKLTYWDEDPDIRLLEKDVADFMGRHLYKPLKDIKIGKLLNNLLELAFQHRLRIPPDIFLMLKAFSAIEGVGLMLDPDFDMIKQAAPFIKEVKLARLSPRRIRGDIFRLAIELFQFVENFPKDILSITRLIKQQKLSLNLEYKGLDKMLSTYDQISNRISFSIIIAALIVGSALIVISKVPPLFYDMSLIGIVGFLAAAIMGIWLLVAILRKGRL
ncbi:MAG: AarF/ABC1/UbiB kinase family protein [Proteobacteria bacterium]|nr:AarF/ABC1/UbiB kinase family protein [Pseudomonadota bacterium]OEU63351.1 MAG: ABC transporter [Desulfobacterales bacterium S5133MH16]